MNLVKLFFLMLVAGGAGGVLGSIVGSGIGRGGLFAGGGVGGVAFVVGAGWLAAARCWIAPAQRLWAIAGGLFGFGLACLVTLSTLSSPMGPILSTLLIGAGGVLGAVLGTSPHAHQPTHAGEPES